jgi:hypothetical protein
MNDFRKSYDGVSDNYRVVRRIVPETLRPDITACELARLMRLEITIDKGAMNSFSEEDSALVNANSEVVK